MPTQEQCPSNQPKVFCCPECGEELESIKYNCYTSGKEYGHCYISEEGYFEDHECDDSETGDSDDYEYECPHCGHDLCESDFRESIPRIPTIKKPDLNEDGKPIQKDQVQEFLDKIILDEGSYRNRHIFDYYGNDEDSEFFHCKICGTLNERGKEEQTPECTKCGTVLIKTMCNEVNLN